MEKIYRYIMLAILISWGSAGFSIAAQTVATDTLIHVSTPSRLVLTENSAGTTISVKSLDGEDGISATVVAEYFPESSVKTNTKEVWLTEWWNDRNLLGRNDDDSYWGVSIDGLCIGLDKALNQTPESGLQWSKSFEISWLSCLNVYYKFSRSSVSLGLGFDWRNYKITTSDRCLVADGKGIKWDGYPEEGKGKYSRLKVFSLQIPLLYSYSIPNSSFSLKAGPIFNFNTYASLKSVWDDVDGNRKEYFTKEIDPRRFTVDFFASVSFCRTIGIYVRYSPMKVMDASPTLNFKPLTVGVGFGI